LMYRPDPAPEAPGWEPGGRFRLVEPDKQTEAVKIMQQRERGKAAKIDYTFKEKHRKELRAERIRAAKSHRGFAGRDFKERADVIKFVRDKEAEFNDATLDWDQKRRKAIPQKPSIFSYSNITLVGASDGYREFKKEKDMGYHQKGEGKTAVAKEIQAPGLHTLQEYSRTIMEEDMQGWFKTKGRNVPNAQVIMQKRAAAVQKLRTMYRPSMSYHREYIA